MAGKRNPMQHIRLVYQRSKPLTKCVVLAALVLSIAALTVLGFARQHAQAKADALRQQAQQLALENEKLEKDIDQLGSVQSIEQIAAEELGLVDPDTVIIETEEPSAD